MNNEALVKLAAEAYVYGYPMVYTIEEQIKRVCFKWVVGARSPRPLGRETLPLHRNSQPK